MIYKLYSSLRTNKFSPQGQGFRILPSLWGHFIPITYGLPKPHTHTRACL